MTRENKIQAEKLILHKTKFKELKRFLLVLSVVLAYLLIISIKLGIKQGFAVTALTWSFFVFCTPIADAGFLLDFPVRLITRIRMIYSEIIVWIIAAAINLFSLYKYPSIYEKTDILKLFKQILVHPYPYWGIIILSMAGTFLSIYFGDELLDVAKHEERSKFLKHRGKHRFIIIAFFILLIIIFYKSLLESLGIKV